MSTTQAKPIHDELPEPTGTFAWLRALGPRGRRAFGGAFGGYALDSYDYFTLPLSMVAISAYFSLDNGQTGLSPRSPSSSPPSAGRSPGSSRTGSAG
jgi:hypothetical protein